MTIVNKAHQANQIYPYAISLIESVRTYERTLEKVSLIYFILLLQFLPAGTKFKQISLHFFRKFY